jgi:hypothetical protein
MEGRRGLQICNFPTLDLDSCFEAKQYILICQNT